jgi:hypothetical protein
MLSIIIIKSPEGGQHEAMKKAPFSFRAGVLSRVLPEGHDGFLTKADIWLLDFVIRYLG